MEETLKDLKDLINRIIDSSPCNEILFSTDYQFGPDESEDYGTISLADFFGLHSLGKLRWNTIYTIKAEPGSSL